MPCYQIITNTVELKAADRVLLKKALEASGSFIEVSLLADGVVQAYHTPTNQYVTLDRNGVTLTEGTEYVADEIKRSYAKESVRAAAEYAGWSVEEEDQNTWEVIHY